jgi:hypothetical protein
MNGRSTSDCGSATHRRWLWLSGIALTAVALSWVGAAVAQPPKPHHHAPIAQPPPPAPPKPVHAPPAHSHAQAPPKHAPPVHSKHVEPPTGAKTSGPPLHAKHGEAPHQGKQQGDPPKHAKDGGPVHHSKEGAATQHAKHNEPDHKSKRDEPARNAKHNEPAHHSKHGESPNHSKQDGPHHAKHGEAPNHSKQGGPVQASHAVTPHHSKHGEPPHHGKNDKNDKNNKTGNHDKHDKHPKNHKHDKDDSKSTSKSAGPAPQSKGSTQSTQPPQKQTTSSASNPNLAPILAAPSPGPSAPAESKGSEPAAAEATRPEFEAPMRVGASMPDRDVDDKRQVGLAGDKAAIGKTTRSVPAAVGSWAAPLPPQVGTYRPNEVLGLNLSPAALERLRREGFKTQGSSASGLTHILLPEGLDPWAAQRRFEHDFQQGFALNFFYNHYRSVLDDNPHGAVPTTPSEGCSTERCYGPKVIGWQTHLAECAEGVKIGVVDTGFDETHPAFTKRAVKPTIVMRPEGNAAPNWHGTSVLSLLAGAPKSSTPGLIPNANFLIADIFFKDDRGLAQTDTVRILEALQRLDEKGAQIINMSLVGPRDELVRRRIVDMSTRKGVLFIAAAGNDGKDAPPGYPAAYEEVIAVTAVDSMRQSYADANRGSYISVAAPGVKIWTAYPGNKEAMVSGTSFAVPFVTAIAAASYKTSRLKTLLADKRGPLDPKGAILAAFSIDKLGNGEPADQRIYGLGLVKAPSSCTPASQPVTARAKQPIAVPDSWPTAVRRTSLQ